ncbi:hypothetical protein C8R46DRAFT_853862, partial [Mycena filopes]
DVLQELHKSFHQRITHADWNALDEDKKVAVAKSFHLRCHLEATRGQRLQAHVADREMEVRSDGVKRVDFLLGRTTFTG